LGYLGKNLLWAGSPLMNQASGGSPTYNADYCKKAAEAFGELLSLTESGQAQHKLLPFAQYFNNFYTTGQNWQIPGGTEAIFNGPYFGANNSNWGTAKQYTPLIISEGDVKFLPTSNYVAYYGMANGMPIKDITKADPESGYNPEFPWRGRDPRFYNDIIYDGVRMVAGSIPNAAEAINRHANLHTGGTYRDIATGSRTGFLLFKFIPRTANKFDQGYSYDKSLNIKVPYMRLADIYLMYAEAAAQGYGSPSGKSSNFNKTSVDAINVLRDRAGVGHVSTKFLGALDAYMEEVRRERAVELAFEGHRFNDLRRWLLIAKSPYTLKKSLEFDRAAPLDPSKDPRENRVLNLREQLILERKFTDKHNCLPLKVNDVNLYLEFSQNPGW
ncbi:MAG TPA: RagB/SusD family nutrient uptake outer membrane protein, partial [Saprospiraceae bacterium]|nr:RagB/SusD family nutrient uptake outer membrane protein [Saprospiraceae bacterium]